MPSPSGLSPYKFQTEIFSYITQLLDVFEAKDESFSEHVMKVWENMLFAVLSFLDTVVAGFLPVNFDNTVGERSGKGVGRLQKHEL